MAPPPSRQAAAIVAGAPRNGRTPSTCASTETAATSCPSAAVTGDAGSTRPSACSAMTIADSPSTARFVAPGGCTSARAARSCKRPGRHGRAEFPRPRGRAAQAVRRAAGPARSAARRREYAVAGGDALTALHSTCRRSGARRRQLEHQPLGLVHEPRLARARGRRDAHVVERESRGEGPAAARRRSRGRCSIPRRAAASPSRTCPRPARRSSRSRRRHARQPAARPGPARPSAHGGGGGAAGGAAWRRSRRRV